jgi:hypothetical protein
MTLNQVVTRIKTICLNHKQIRSFHFGRMEDFLANKDRVYPAVVLQTTSGSISLSGHASTFNCRMFFFDKVNVAASAKENETDVLSDMVSVAMDILSQINHGNYSDWRISTNNNLELITEDTEDSVAGCYVDTSIDIIFKQNVCAVPTTHTIYAPVQGRRIRITLNRDVETGSLTMLLSDITETEYIPLTEFTDYTKGWVMTTADGSQARVTAYKDETTGSIQLILSPV